MTSEATSIFDVEAARTEVLSHEVPRMIAAKKRYWPHARILEPLTSVTAIVALTAGKLLGWSWLDQVMGIVGGAVVSVWAYGLVRDTSGILFDRTPESSDLPDEIRRAVESDGDSLVTDVHVWRVDAGKFAAIVSIVAHDPKPAETYRELFREHEELVHVTVEIQRYHER